MGFVSHPESCVNSLPCLFGSGYTVEGQKTSVEAHGGLQIEVIPKYQDHLRRWFQDTDGHVKTLDLNDVDIDWSQNLNEHDTPASIGLRVGQSVRSYAEPALQRKPLNVEGVAGQRDAVTPQAKYWTSNINASFSLSDPLLVPEFSMWNTKAHAATPATATVTTEAWETTLFSGKKKKAKAKNQWSLGSNEGVYLLNLEIHSSCDTLPEQEPAAEEVLEVQTRDPKAMGLAIDGKIVQDIY
ncbi:hypothetical protein BU23DRAFT_39223 [Bimuria novae-zelandiae CBS 107.79]|uniref:Uncharacterized protein n=1 Tax=Bimuria novae-zelandiae CBS 107.79 TaxID=1447943 RepID=A0A6A5UJA8_9PLEO|nr:hypothetical protein BU23DRAFT_39223 [Bimuria novae-zelandiae CBS 107.79]